MISGRVPVMFQTLLPVAGAVASGEVKLLAVAAPKRLPNHPDLPTVEETVPGFTASGWSILVAPHGTPAPIVQKINADLRNALSEPELAEEVPGSRQLHALDDAAGARELSSATSGKNGDRSSGKLPPQAK